LLNITGQRFLSTRAVTFGAKRREKWRAKYKWGRFE